MGVKPVKGNRNMQRAFMIELFYMEEITVLGKTFSPLIFPRCLFLSISDLALRLLSSRIATIPLCGNNQHCCLHLHELLPNSTGYLPDLIGEKLRFLF